VDPAGLHHIHGVADGAGGAAAAIYKWLGIKGAFPEAVRLALSGIGDAKLYRYPLPEKLRKEQQARLDAEAVKKKAEAAGDKKPDAVAAAASSAATGGAPQQELPPLPSPGSFAEFSAAHKEQLIKAKSGGEKDLITDRLFSRAVIHAIGPDFRVGKWTDREASMALARAYRNVLHEFVMSDCDTLRIAPISGGIFSGDLYNMMPVLTQEGLALGFDQLHEYDKEVLLRPGKRIELCIFLLREWDTYVNSFDFIKPPESYAAIAKAASDAPASSK
jgi:hypothetical protein